MSGELVLVTGGSGFIGTHCILQLLEAGYRVRTTVRSLASEQSVRAALRAAGAGRESELQFSEANLTADLGWDEAVAGCSFVLHVASPFPVGVPKDENELIVPAREGALRVLHAAKAAGVKRIVLTSSFAAIGYGPITDTPFSELDWTDPNGAAPYIKSKTLAERAAWDYVHGAGQGLELAVVNPVGVLGPVLSGDLSASIELVKQLLDGSVPGTPNIHFGIVDVRDVAALHLLAMTSPAAAGQRFLAISEDVMSLGEVAEILRRRVPELARRVPTRSIPNWIVRALAVVSPALRQITPELGRVKHTNGAKARDVLGWSPRSREDAIVATAQSLADLGLLKK